MRQYRAFHFEGYEWDEAAREVRLRYAFDRELHFTDTVRFEFAPDAGYSREGLDRVLRGLWLMAGVSYLKTALPPQIIVHGPQLGAEEAAFFSQAYRLGLGQLCYENQLSLERVAVFPAGGQPTEPVRVGEGGDVLALGGGKDSLVSAAVLEAAGVDFATFSAPYTPESNTALAELAHRMGRPYLPARRRFDPQLLELNRTGAYNGHVPVTAILMFIGLAVAVLSGRRRVIFSNEASSGEGNVLYEGVEINHQYSKSLEFERLMQRYVRAAVSPDLDCFSLLRPLGELQIAQLFAAGPMDRYQGYFSSCNRSFRHGSEGFTWCGECPKCAFVFLALAPFAPKERLIALFGADLLARDRLAGTYGELLGLHGHKPFECVGEIEECRAALRLVIAEGKYPAAARFELPPGNYDRPRLHPSAMPQVYRQYLEQYRAEKE